MVRAQQLPLKNVGVGMHRPHLEAIPAFHLPPGYAFRPWRAGDIPAWITIQDAADQYNDISRETFRREFDDREDLMADRSWFVVSPEGTDVGSITAWWRQTPQGPQGLIHWVAVLPEHQGKGIGKAMMTKAMLRLREEYRDAYLNTSSARLPAIKLYLDFGFVPDMERKDAVEGWADVRKHLKHPALGDAP